MTRTDAFEEAVTTALGPDPALVELVMETFLGKDFRDADYVCELVERRERATSEASTPGAGTAAAANVVTADDATRVVALVRARTCSAVVQLALAYSAICDDIRAGLRCGSCFRTHAQAEAETHNCTEEC